MCYFVFSANPTPLFSGKTRQHSFSEQSKITKNNTTRRWLDVFGKMALGLAFWWLGFSVSVLLSFLKRKFSFYVGGATKQWWDTNFLSHKCIICIKVYFAIFFVSSGTFGFVGFILTHFWCKMSKIFWGLFRWVWTTKNQLHWGI